MAKKFSKEEIRSRFDKKIAEKKPVIAGSAGSGLVAKLQDLAGVDLIMVYNTAVFRMDGAHGTLGLLPYGDGNTMTLELARVVLPRVKNTPVIGGVGAADPYRDIDRLLDQMLKMGFSGFTNVPCGCARFEWLRGMMEGAGMGLDQDVKLIKKCYEKKAFTVVYAFTEDQIRALAQAGADVISAHAGQTAGGLLGSTNVMDIDEACELTQKVYEIVKKENPDTYVFCHGGPFWNPENTQYGFDHTDAQGFIGASCMERIPVEDAIMEAVTELKGLKLR